MASTDIARAKAAYANSLKDLFCTRKIYHPLRAEGNLLNVPIRRKTMSWFDKVYVGWQLLRLEKTTEQR